MWPLVILAGVVGTVALLTRKKAPAHASAAALETHVATKTGTFVPTSPELARNLGGAPSAPPASSAGTFTLPTITIQGTPDAAADPSAGAVTPAGVFMLVAAGQPASFFLTSAGQAVTRAYQLAKGVSGAALDGKYGPHTRAMVVADGFPNAPPAPVAYGGTG